MRPMKAAIAALALLAGCYSPTYRDCEVGCASGACPAGLSCDPALRVCRVEGATGACGVTADATPSDSTGRDVSASNYCALAPPHLFCQDFDTGTISTQGWQVSTTPGSNVTLVPSTQSLPNALESQTPSTDGSAPAEAVVFATLTVPSGFTQLRVGFDVNFAERAGALQPKGAFRIEALPGFSVGLSSNGPNQVYTLVNDDTASQVFDNQLVLGTWYRYEIYFAVNGNLVDVYLTRDGALVTTDGRIGSGPLPPETAAWQIRLGASNTSSNGVCRFLFDNVLVTTS